ncbi:MAG TPA: acyl-CoA dehydrogenase family protein [Rubrivivax sp.]|nr:acyl-CoA dehydrogenase family protein [Rubrivivax sp.]
MNEFAESLDRLLTEQCPPARVRAIERGADTAPLWQALEQSGFLDAMVPAERDGAGLALAEAFDLFTLQGRHALPVPMAREIAARAIGVSGAGELPRELGAVVWAAQIVGALERVLELSVAFANQREQFGRPIGKFQAVQHQLAVMAEHVAAARIAAQIGYQGAGPLPDALQAAVAKARTSEAAALVAPMAHAVHGAIGVTAEFDLQLYTRRLHQWRGEYGSELAWQRVLGRAVLAAPQPLTLDFMRERLLPTGA